jgi:hypothetical protein
VGLVYIVKSIFQMCQQVSKKSESRPFRCCLGRPVRNFCHTFGMSRLSCMNRLCSPTTERIAHQRPDLPGYQALQQEMLNVLRQLIAQGTGIIILQPMTLLLFSCSGPQVKYQVHEQFDSGRHPSLSQQIHSGQLSLWQSKNPISLWPPN